MGYRANTEKMKHTDRPLFDSQWRMDCTVEPATIKEMDHFIQAHYLQKRPAIVLLCLKMIFDERPVGTIVFSAPPRGIEKRYGGTTWELARLYLLDSIPRNAETWLIAKAVKFIKKNHRHVLHLISYADPSAGHAGTIYKAANWKSDGRTDQERKTPRCDYVDGRTGKKYGRRGNMPTDAIVQRKPRVSKFRFHLPLK